MHIKRLLHKPLPSSTSPNGLVIHLPGLHPTSQACSSFARPDIQWAETKQSLIGKKGTQFLIQLLLSVWEIGYTHHPLLFSQASSSSSVKREHELLTLWFDFTASLFPFWPLALGLSRVRPSSERQALFAILSASLDSGRLCRGADNDQMLRAGPTPCVSSTHHVTGYRWRPGDEVFCTVPYRTPKPAPVLTVPAHIQLCELYPSVFCLPWLNQRT